MSPWGWASAWLPVEGDPARWPDSRIYQHRPHLALEFETFEMFTDGLGLRAGAPGQPAPGAAGEAREVMARVARDAGEQFHVQHGKMVLELKPASGIAVAIDVSSADEPHPANKQAVGRRLALHALAKAYGREEVVCSGPAFRSMSVEGAKARLHFDHVGGNVALSVDGALVPIPTPPVALIKN